jgi:hypothetical protein
MTQALALPTGVKLISQRRPMRAHAFFDYGEPIAVRGTALDERENDRYR